MCDQFFWKYSSITVWAIRQKYEGKIFALRMKVISRTIGKIKEMEFEMTQSEVTDG
jgi:hypothetical protein